MSDTPETDLLLDNQHHDCVPYDDAAGQLADLARKLEQERDRALKLLAEMKQAIIWAKAEAKERLHRLDQAACERRTWLEATHKMKLERDEARAERDEWIARFRADEQLIKEAMEKHE